MSDWNWVDAQTLMLLHDESLAEHGGAPGLRDEGLLHSALARPQNPIAYGDPDFADLAAAYGSELAKNPPFMDGNKRAGFLAVGLFLALNGWRLVAAQADATLTALDVAAGGLCDEELAEWIRTHTVPRTR